MVFCLEVSEPLLFTKDGRNVYIAKKRAMVKKDRNSDIQKREICLTNFEKGTLIGTIIVILTGLFAYGQISKGIFGPFSYPLLMSMHRAFLENNVCGLFWETRGRKYTKSKIVYNIFTRTWTMWKATSH